MQVILNTDNRLTASYDLAIAVASDKLGRLEDKRQADEPAPGA